MGSKTKLTDRLETTKLLREAISVESRVGHWLPPFPPYKTTVCGWPHSNSQCCEMGVQYEQKFSCKTSAHIIVNGHMLMEQEDKENKPEHTQFTWLYHLIEVYQVWQVPCLEHREDIMTSSPQAIRSSANHKQLLSTHRYDRATALAFKRIRYMWLMHEFFQGD